MLPSDPRTWTDFSDPAAHGFDKIDCNTTLERVLVLGATAMGIAAAFIVTFASSRPSGAPAPVPWLRPDVMAILVPGLIIGAALLLILRWLTDNFYLIDLTRHAVYLHSQFLRMRRVRLLLEHQDIFAMAVQTQLRRSRYSSWWENRTVLVDTRGRIVPMSNWDKDALWSSNNRAEQIATELSCPCFTSPDRSRLVVRSDAGRPTVTYKDYSRILTFLRF